MNIIGQSCLISMARVVLCSSVLSHIGRALQLAMRGGMTCDASLKQLVKLTTSFFGSTGI